MSLFAQLTVNGLIAGSIYALVAAGFSLIYGTNKYMHFAHGVSVVFAGYVMYAFFTFGGQVLFLTFVPAIALTALFGLSINLFIYTPLQKRKASNVILLISSIAIGSFSSLNLKVRLAIEITVLGIDSNCPYPELPTARCSFNVFKAG